MGGRNLDPARQRSATVAGNARRARERARAQAAALADASAIAGADWDHCAHDPPANAVADYQTASDADVKANDAASLMRLALGLPVNRG